MPLNHLFPEWMCSLAMCSFVCRHLVPKVKGLSCIFQLQIIARKKHGIWVHQFRTNLVLHSGFHIEYLAPEFSVSTLYIFCFKSHIKNIWIQEYPLVKMYNATVCKPDTSAKYPVLLKGWTWCFGGTVKNEDKGLIFRNNRTILPRCS